MHWRSSQQSSKTPTQHYLLRFARCLHTEKHYNLTAVNYGSHCVFKRTQTCLFEIQLQLYRNHLNCGPFGCFTYGTCQTEALLHISSPSLALKAHPAFKPWGHNAGCECVTGFSRSDEAKQAKLDKAFTPGCTLCNNQIHWSGGKCCGGILKIRWLKWTYPHFKWSINASLRRNLVMWMSIEKMWWSAPGDTFLSMHEQAARIHRSKKTNMSVVQPLSWEQVRPPNVP